MQGWGDGGKREELAILKPGRQYFLRVKDEFKASSGTYWKGLRVKRSEKTEEQGCGRAGLQWAAGLLSGGGTELAGVCAQGRSLGQDGYQGLYSSSNATVTEYLKGPKEEGWSISGQCRVFQSMTTWLLHLCSQG